MSCKLELPKNELKAENEIYLLNEFPGSLEDLHKKATQKFGSRLPVKYRLKYEQQGKEARYITTEEGFKQLVTETNRFKLLIDPLPQEVPEDSLLALERQLTGMKSYSEPVKTGLEQFTQIPLAESNVYTKPVSKAGQIEILKHEKATPIELKIEQNQSKVTDNLKSQKVPDDLVIKKFEELFQVRLSAEVAKINEKFQAMQTELNEIKGVNNHLVQIIKAQNLGHLLEPKSKDREKISKTLQGNETEAVPQQLKKVNENPLRSKTVVCSGCKASFSADTAEENKDAKELSFCNECIGKIKLDSAKMETSVIVKAYKVKIVDVPPQISALVPGADYKIPFSIKNAGELTWAEDTVLECISGCHLKKFVQIGAKRPDQEHKLLLSLTAPDQPGLTQSCWRLRYFDAESNQHKYFGPKFTFEVEIKQSVNDKPQTILVGDVSLKYPKEVQEKAKTLLELTGGNDITKLLELVNRNPSATLEELVEKIFN